TSTRSLRQGGNVRPATRRRPRAAGPSGLPRQLVRDLLSAGPSPTLNDKPEPVGAEYCVTSCDLQVLVDETQSTRRPCSLLLPTERGARMVPRTPLNGRQQASTTAADLRHLT